MRWRALVPQPVERSDFTRIRFEIVIRFRQD